MSRIALRSLLLLAVLAPVLAPAQAPPPRINWEEGKHYQIIAPAVSTGQAPAGKIEVTEVFSYGCPFCYQAISEVRRLGKPLPADTVLTYVHASFNSAEAWPMFQRAYYTARSLGIADANHDRMFLAIWETGSFPLIDEKTGRMRETLPTLQDAADFYAKNSSVSAADFMVRAGSAEVEAQVRAAEAFIRGARVTGTPAIVVNGRYLIDSAAAGSWDNIRQLVDFLLVLERARLKLPPPKRP